MNVELEKANRVADFLELGELLALDALERNESCGGHFREEYQTPKANACATTKTINMWPPGNMSPKANSGYTKNRWFMRKRK